MAASSEAGRAPDGSPDENVFDIQQGVAIVFLVKRTDDRQGPAEVYHADLYGARTNPGGNGKYEWLLDNDITTTKWEKLEPTSPQYWFVPFDASVAREYNAGWSLKDIFEKKSVGVLTAKDDIAVGISESEMTDLGKSFVNKSVDKLAEEHPSHSSSRNWSLADAKDDLEQCEDVTKSVTPLLYRPYDHRYTIYTGRTNGFIHRPRRDGMGHLIDAQVENLALVSCRQ